MRIPRAPSYKTVFLFGAGYNTIVEQCWWAVALCLGMAFIGLPLLDRLGRATFRTWDR